jgi:hypothetical protein
MGLFDPFGGGSSSSATDNRQAATDQGVIFGRNVGAYTAPGALSLGGKGATLLGANSRQLKQSGKGNVAGNVSTKTTANSNNKNKSTNITGNTGTAAVYNDANASVANNAINQFASLATATQGITASLVAQQANLNSGAPPSAEPPSNFFSSIADAVSKLVGTGAAAASPQPVTNSGGGGGTGSGSFWSDPNAGQPASGIDISGAALAPHHASALTWILIAVGGAAGLAFLIHLLRR